MLWNGHTARRIDVKPNFEIPSVPLENRNQFSDSFFSRSPQRRADIALTPELTRTYDFPTYYGNVTSAMGIFLCDYGAAQAILPHPGMKPVRMTRGKSLVILSCYHYANVLGIPAYNEIAMTVPILAGPGRDWPVLPMLAPALFPQAGYYVFGMPVTSKENQLRGNNIWGLPKVTQEIDLQVDGDTCVTVAKEVDATPYFTLRVPTNGKETHFDASGWIYSKLGDRLLRAQTQFKGTFRVTKNLAVLWREGRAPERPSLEIGQTPSAAILRSLQIEPEPFQFRFAHHVNSTFDLPDPTWQPHG